MKLTRLAEISSVFLDEGLGFLTERKPRADDGETEELPSESELGQRLRRTLERLGPTFVKFGQMLATRVDMFDEHVIAELGKLHSRVTPFSNEEAREVLETELGAPVDAIFSELSEDCVAAASIAQVYKGRLKDDEDAVVAVKVQRPGLEDSLLSDLDVLVDVSGFIDALVPKYRRAMVHRVAEEYSHRARLEIDFLAEATAMEHFGEVLETLPEFRIPKVYRELCTPKVLVMEWMEGTKLDELATPADVEALGFDPESVARSMLRLQLSMSYEHGVVHGDTHPGNVFLLSDGQIGLIDFGLNAHVPRALREKMLETLFYASSGRVDEAASCFAEVIGPESGAERTALENDLRQVIAGASAVEDDEQAVTRQLVDGLRVAARHRIKARSELFIVVRNLAIVEGIVRRYGPDLDVAEELEQITGSILRRRLFGPSIREEMTALVPQIVLTLSKRPRLAERLLQMERSFVDSKNFGEFLRRERILQPPPPPRGYGAFALVVVGLLGAAVGFALHMLTSK